MARNDPQVNFRIPADLKDRLETAALASGRTLTAEVVSRLQGSFQGDIVEAVRTEVRAAIRELLTEPHARTPAARRSARRKPA